MDVSHIRKIILVIPSWKNHNSSLKNRRHPGIKQPLPPKASQLPADREIKPRLARPQQPPVSASSAPLEKYCVTQRFTRPSGRSGSMLRIDAALGEICTD